MLKKCFKFKTWQWKCGLRCQSDAAAVKEPEGENGVKPRFNAINIQMLSEGLHRQIFKSTPSENISVCREVLEKTKVHLQDHGLWDKETGILPDVDFQLPELLGDNIADHFHQLASDQTAEYKNLADSFVQCKLPPKPMHWEIRPGWTRYKADGTSEPVVCPQEPAMVFDIEVLVPEGNFPTMATAATPKSWYSWCSKRLIEDQFNLTGKISMDDLIPLEEEPSRKRLVIGHNVGFDRSFVKEQYHIKSTDTRFLDTMSMHIAVSGFTSFQRVLWNAKKGMKTDKVSTRKEVLEFEDRSGWTSKGPPGYMWMEEGSRNNLNDVYQYYCKTDEPLKKEMRNMFVRGNMSEIRLNVQDLMTYCSGDVEATWNVFVKLWPLFHQNCPHPVTLAGMLEMGMTYLPVNSNWEKFIKNAEFTYNDQQSELKTQMMKLANDACDLFHCQQYKDNIWLWDLNWEAKDIKMKASKKTKKKRNINETEETVEDRINRVVSTAESLWKVQPNMAGYPLWYVELCMRENKEDWMPGPNQISSKKRVAPKLLGLCWDGYPVHYDETLGWGYLIPGRPIPEPDNLILADEKEDQHTSTGPEFPYEKLTEFCPYPVEGTGKGEPSILQKKLTQESTEELSLNGKQISEAFAKVRGEKKNNKLRKKASSADKPDWYEGDGPYNEVNIPGCWFYKIPHKDGKGKKVGDPLAKDYLEKIEDGTLTANSGLADRFLKLIKMCSYWKNNRDRIMSQMVVWLTKEELSNEITRHIEDGDIHEYGAIVPRVIPAGTVTRRAVEPTWLTASNVYRDRIGSELKAIVQSPPGYHLIGADVDSQELWIAAILGDSHFGGIHGCTAFGWMTLQGQKTQGTDLHSRTAHTVGCTRDQAKVLNYGRIYGGGKLFAKRLLLQFNHRLEEKEANNKVNTMYRLTKGLRKPVGRKKTDESSEDVISDEGKTIWTGGSESEMFNSLERIADSPVPKTPVLNCQISSTLQPQNVQTEFMTSRVNWVVQSSAVDYLHLMLVSMRWLFEKFNIEGRFCISIHDEVRYIVKSEDRYRAALALQITNLLTRSMFAYKMNMKELPQAVAFFSTVDIDTCLRKEVTLDCKTPSNPHGIQVGYNIPEGEALDIYEILSKTKGSLLKEEQN